jgi:putative glutamine amidotransferase
VSRRGQQEQRAERGEATGAGAATALRPLIGLSSYAERAAWGAWEHDAFALPRRYADRVAGAGGIPVLLPPVPGAVQAVARLDGLLLSGGGDIDPVRFGAPADPATVSVRPERDAAEFEMLAAARSLGLPVLGICRGLQVINVACGGSLHQHLPDVVGHDGHSPAPGSYGWHDVTVAPGTRLADILGRTDLSDHLAAAVPTHHHQGISRLGHGLVAAAWASDGIVEAVEPESAAAPFLIGVQWHPEAGHDDSLFRALVAAARQYRSTGAPPAPVDSPA